MRVAAVIAVGRPAEGKGGRPEDELDYSKIKFENYISS
jgi:hypothetical protein